MTPTKTRYPLIVACSLVLLACASPPAAEKPTAPAPAVPAATTAESDSQAASVHEKRFEDAARSYKKVQKDGQTLYCKRERVIGSTIPKMQCLTETQLRIQVENTDDLRQRMRRGGGPCVQTGGCSGG